MSKIALKITNYSASELRSLLRKDGKFQQGVRLYACYQVSLGKRPQELEEVYGVSFKSICNWVHCLNKGGVKALEDKPRPGRSPRLNGEQMQAIKQMVLDKTPEELGYNSATWSGPLLISFIKKEYKIDYQKAQIYNILKQLGLSFQKGKGVYAEAKHREEQMVVLKKTSRRKTAK